MGQRLRRLVPALSISLLLFGCASDRLHDEGMSLIDQGQYEEGMAKLSDAVREDPKNLSYRSDMIHKREQIVQAHIRAGDEQRAAGKPEEAAENYQQALKFDPGNPRARSGLNKLDMDKRHAEEMRQADTRYARHDIAGAQQLLRKILLEDPANSDARAMQRKIDDILEKDAMVGPRLRPEFQKPVTLEFRDANLKMVVEALSRSSGLNILLDKDVRNDLKTTIFVKDASVVDTIDLIALQNELQKKILSDNTVLLYPNTPAKLKEYQDLIIRSFELTNADAKDMQTMLKTLLKTKDSFVDEKTNSLVIRDTPDAVQLASRLISAHDLPEAEVMLEVEVLEVTRSRLSELGIKLPEQISISASGVPAQTTVNTLPGGGVVTTTTPAQPLNLDNLSRLKNSDFTVSPLNASIDLKNESGDVNILASPRIRVRNREKAKILIGDRVPVITNAITPVSTGTPVVTGNVQYLDVGLKLDVEPDIHRDDDVAIKINLEVSSIANQVVSGPTLAYQIGTRTANTVLRLKDGETEVLAGLINDQDRKAAQKFPGLGDLPIIGRLFSSHKNDANKTEIVLSITPHIIRGVQRPDAQNTEFWSGTDDTLRSRPITLQPTISTLASNTIAPKPAVVASDAPPPVTVAKASPANRPQAIPTPADTLPSGPPSLSWQGPTEAKVGDEFQVTVDAQSAEPLGTLSFTLGYDAAAMSVVKIDEGKLLQKNGARTIFTSKIDSATGHAFIYATRTGPRGITGQGSVAVITFKAAGAKAQAPLVINSPKVIGSNGTKLPTPLSTPLVMSIKQ